MRKLCVLLICAFQTVIGSALAEDYSAEAEILAQEIVDIHPRGEEIAATDDFIKARAALTAMAGDAGLVDYVMALGRLFHAADDGHTAVLPFYGEAPEFTHRYPVRLKRFDDGLYVVAAKGEATALLGGRLTRIGGRDVDPLLRDFADVMPAGNRAWPSNWLATGMVLPGYLEGLGAAPEAMETPVRFEVVSPKGRRASALLLPAEDGGDDLTEIGQAKTIIENLGETGENYSAEFADGAALYIRIGQMGDEDERSFRDFSIDAATRIAETKAERLIIDIRDNGGGDNMLVEPLRRLIVRSRFNRPGGIFVLTAPQTFSAAMNFATRLERETDALFVGEPTGGSPNHFGDPKFSAGEISALPYIISTLRWQDMPAYDERRWILPDLPAVPRYADFLAGRDLAVETALSASPAVEDMTDAWAIQVAEPWERASQKQGWRFFYEARP